MLTKEKQKEKTVMQKLIWGVLSVSYVILFPVCFVSSTFCVGYSCIWLDNTPTENKRFILEKGELYICFYYWLTIDNRHEWQYSLFLSYLPSILLHREQER